MANDLTKVFLVGDTHEIEAALPKDKIPAMVDYIVEESKGEVKRVLREKGRFESKRVLLTLREPTVEEMRAGVTGLYN